MYWSESTPVKKGIVTISAVFVCDIMSVSESTPVKKGIVTFCS